MFRSALSFLLLLVAAAVAAGQSVSTPTTTSKPSEQTPAQAKPAPAAPHTNLKVGQAAPNFTLPSSINGPDGRKVRYTLSDFKGKKNVVLAFYIFAFTGG